MRVPFRRVLGPPVQLLAQDSMPLSIGRAIRGEAIGGFPQADFHNGKAIIPGIIEDDAGDVLCRRVRVEKKKRLSQFQEHGDDRVVAVKDHTMIEVFVNPLADNAFDVGKI